jgi:hypothetical protein
MKNKTYHTTIIIYKCTVKYDHFYMLRSDHERYFHQPFYAEVINRDGNIKSDTSKFIKSLINLIRYIL